MKIKTCIFVFFFSICLYADNPISIDSANVLIRKHMVTAFNLSTNFGMTTTDCVVDSLWKELKIQLFFTEFTSSSGGTYFRSEMFLYHRGTMRIFGRSHGSLNSGVVVNKTLYLTYSWGSGIQRTHVCRFFQDADSLKIQDWSEGFIVRGNNYFVDVDADGKLYLEFGYRKSFNVWDPSLSVPKWYIDTTEHAFVKVVDSSGNVIPGWLTSAIINPPPVKAITIGVNYKYVTLNHSRVESNGYNVLGRCISKGKQISTGMIIVPNQRRAP